ncbi:MAG: hypothetical protein LBO02_01055 [Holosporaceae bacterium]|jgi:poly(A) polymerase|nr:hypothetical protein [Holosporaceae bacterium]
MGCSKNNFPIDDDAFFILDLIEKCGHRARVVGGAVRNFLLKRESSDLDLATSATPSEIIDLCGQSGLRVKPIGVPYGSLRIIYNRRSYEITSLRKDIKTFGRHAEIKFSKSFRTDSNRRDFTVNALYMDKRGTIYDYHSGIEDIRSGNIRFIGDAKKRIAEDYLRILRYFRFVAAYGNYKCNPQYLEIISDLKSDVKILSGERIIGELLKIFAIPRSNEIIPPMREVLDELFSLKFNSLDIAAKLGVFESLSAVEKLSMLLKFSQNKNLTNDYNFPKTIRETLSLKAEPSKRIFEKLKRIKKKYRIFYAKFLAINAYLNEAYSMADAQNFLRELLNFCGSKFADFQLKSNDLKELDLTKDEFKRVMMATREFWLKNRVSPDECKNFALEYIQARYAEGAFPSDKK